MYEDQPLIVVQEVNYAEVQAVSFDFTFYFVMMVHVPSLFSCLSETVPTA